MENTNNIPTAYEGKEPYIFVSYAHKDSVRVLPFILKMQQAGLRVWFDKGIEAGTEWPEYIESHLLNADRVVVFMSEAAVSSANCRNEINLAFSEKKKILVVYLEETELRHGMKLQLSSVQSVYVYREQDEDQHIQEICDMRLLSSCKPSEKPLKKRRTPMYIALGATLIAIFLCILLPLLLTDKNTSSLYNSQYGASMILTEGEFLKDTVFLIKKVTPNEPLRGEIEKLPINNEVYHVFDLSLRLENGEVNIDRTAVITMPVPEGISADKAVVYHILGETIEKITSSVSNGKISFSNNQLGIYVIAEAETSQGTVGEDDNDSTDNNDGTEDQFPAIKNVVLSFNANGGEGSMAQQTISVGESANLMACAFEKAGFVFGGWATSADGVVAYANGASFEAEAEAELVLYAIWIPNMNTLIFDANGGGGYMDTVSIKTNESISLPSNCFAKSGYTFVGWSDVRNGAVKYTNCQSFEMTSSATVTLYAVWNANTNSITLKANDGTTNEATVSMKTDESKKLPVNTFVRKGYSFVGWSTTSAGAVQYEDGSIYVMGDSSVTLYAVWQPNSNKIVFNANGGTGLMEAQLIPTGEKATLSTCVFTYDGYIFAGWATTKSGDIAYANSASYTMGEENSYVLYAVWTKAAYTITYHMNGGSNSLSNPVGYDVTDATINLANPERDGYTFMGWYTEETFQNKITAIPNGSTGNKVFYASWSANTNSINFNANGGSGTMTAQQAKTDEAVVLKQSLFTRNGYTFKGWSTSPNGAVLYADKASYTTGTSDTVTLYAIWEPITYSVSYDLQGGTVSGNKTSYDVTTNTFVLPTPTKTGYSFLGWSGTDIDGVQKTVTISNGSIGDRSYTANWGAKEYTVTLDADGGTVSPTTIKIKYNESITYPTPTKTGYTFAGWFSGTTEYSNGKWSYDNNVSLKAEWTANTNTVYTVKHYLENVNDNGYTLQDTQTLYGTTGAVVSPNPKTYTGFNTPSKATVKILPDGSAVLEYRYTRTICTITFVTNGGDAINTMTVKYQQTVTMPNAVRDGFTFGGWFTDVALTNALQGATSSNTTLYAWWREETKPSDFTYSGTTKITINGYTGSDTYLGIPAYIGGVPVTTIPANTFKGLNKITEIVVPRTVTDIGAAAFEGCNALEKITLPFAGHSRSTNTGQPSSSRDWNGGSPWLFGYIFGGNVVHTSGDTPPATTADYVYQGQSYYHTTYDCYYWFVYYIPTTLQEVVITDATGISPNTFYGCTMLTNVTINDGITLLGNKAFYNCMNLLTLNSSNDGEFVLPAGVTTIGEYAFYNCVNMESISFDATVISIGNNAFADSAGLESVNYGGMTEANWNFISIGTGNDFLKSAERTYYKGTMKITLDLNGFSWATSGYKIAVVFTSSGNSQWVEMTQVGSLYVCDIPDGYETSEFKFVRVQGNDLNEANIKHQTSTFTTIMNTRYKLTSWSAAEKY